jgi:hypothetical protein
MSRVGEDGTLKLVKGYTAWKILPPAVELLVCKSQVEVRLDGVNCADNRPGADSPMSCLPAALELDDLIAILPVAAEEDTVILSSRATVFCNPNPCTCNFVQCIGIDTKSELSNSESRIETLASSLEGESTYS